MKQLIITKKDFVREDELYDKFYECSNKECRYSYLQSHFKYCPYCGKTLVFII